MERTVVNLKVSWILDFCQIAKNNLWNFLKTNEKISAKPTEDFIHTISKLSVEKKYIMSYPEFFKGPYFPQ